MLNKMAYFKILLQQEQGKPKHLSQGTLSRPKIRIQYLPKY
jgi:hypothetical protein